MALKAMPGCSVCTKWAVQAVEVKDMESFELIQAARWTPLVGLDAYDSFFPHVTGGLRGRKIKVTSVDVSREAYCCRLFHNCVNSLVWVEKMMRSQKYWR